MWARARGTFDYSKVDTKANAGHVVAPSCLTKLNVGAQAASTNKTAVARKEHMKKLAENDERARVRAARVAKGENVDPNPNNPTPSEVGEARVQTRHIKAPWDYDEDDLEMDQRETEAEALKRVQSARDRAARKLNKEQAMKVKNTALYSKPKTDGGDAPGMNANEEEDFANYLRGDTPSDAGGMQF